MMPDSPEGGIAGLPTWAVVGGVAVLAAGVYIVEKRKSASAANSGGTAIANPYGSAAVGTGVLQPIIVDSGIGGGDTSGSAIPPAGLPIPTPTSNGANVGSSNVGVSAPASNPVNTSPIPSGTKTPSLTAVPDPSIGSILVAMGVPVQRIGNGWYYSPGNLTYIPTASEEVALNREGYKTVNIGGRHYYNPLQSVPHSSRVA